MHELLRAREAAAGLSGAEGDDAELALLLELARGPDAPLLMSQVRGWVGAANGGLLFSSALSFRVARADGWFSLFAGARSRLSPHQRVASHALLVCW